MTWQSSRIMMTMNARALNILFTGFGAYLRKRRERHLHALVYKHFAIWRHEFTIEAVFKAENFDCLIHLATKYIKAHQSLDDVQQIMDINIKFPSMLCEFCAIYGVRYFINTGTFFEYKFKDSALSEKDEIEAYNLYSASKIAFSEILKYYSVHKGLNVADFKLFAPFGDMDNEKLMAFLVKKINSGETVDFSEGQQKWSFTYVKDIAWAYVCALKNFSRIKGYEAFNVGSSEVCSIKDVALALANLAGKKLNFKWGSKPYADKEILYAQCDNSKLKKMLGWSLVYGFEYGIKKTYEHFSKGKSNE